MDHDSYEVNYEYRLYELFLKAAIIDVKNDLVGNKLSFSNQIKDIIVNYYGQDNKYEIDKFFTEIFEYVI